MDALKLCQAMIIAGVATANPTFAQSDFTVFFNAGDEATYSGFKGFIPIEGHSESGKKLLFSEAQVASQNNGSISAGFLGGYRTISNKHILGLYGGVDIQQNKSDHLHHQIVLGAERLGSVWDSRINVYAPTSKRLEFGEFKASNESKDVFSGNALQKEVTAFKPGGYFTEEAMTSISAEVGRLIPNDRNLELRAYLGAYHSTAKAAGDATGGRIRLEAFPTENFKADFSISHDELFKTRASMNLSLTLGKKANEPGIRTLEERLTQPTYRHVGIQDTSSLKEDERVVYLDQTSNVGQITTVQKGITHINNDSSQILNPSAAKGTQENPFNSIAECQNATSGIHCGNSDVIYIHTGKSVTTSGSQDKPKRETNQDNATPYVGNFNLNEGQMLVGDGALSGVFKNVSNKVNPVIVSGLASNSGSPTAIVNLNNNSTLQGVRLGWHFGLDTSKPSSQQQFKALANGYMSDVAVSAYNKSDYSIKDVGITGYIDYINGKQDYSSTNNFKTGIDIYNDNGSSTGSITNVTVQGALEDGIKIKASDDQDKVVSQTVILKGVSTIRNGRGIHVLADDSTAGTALNQAVTITSYKIDKVESKSTMERNNNEGLLVESSSGLVNQSVKVSKAQIQDNIGSGIFADFGQSASGQNNGSKLKVYETFVFQNEGGGVVVKSNGGSSDVLIKDSQIFGNIKKPSAFPNLDKNQVGNIDGSLNKTLDDQDICATPDCGRNMGQGMGLYAENNDSNADSTQTITVEGYQPFVLHNKAQIYLKSNANNANSKQSLSLKKSNSNAFTQDASKLKGRYLDNGKLDTVAASAAGATPSQTLGVIYHSDTNPNDCNADKQFFYDDAVDYVKTGAGVPSAQCTEKEVVNIP